MSNPRKEKPPEKDLAKVVMGCWLIAVVLFVCSTWAYLHRADLVIKKATVPIDTYNNVLDLVLTLAIQMPFFLGFTFFVFGCLVWEARRKLHRAKSNEVE